MFSKIEILVLDKKKLLQWMAVAFPVSLILAGLCFYYLDVPLALYFRGDDNLPYWIFARTITNIGLGSHYFIFVFILLITMYRLAPRLAWGKKNPEKVSWLKAWGWSFFAALMMAGFFLRLFKFLFGRLRPHASPFSTHDEFLFFTHDWNYQSFPSGHTQVLFTVATMLCVLDQKRRVVWFSLALILSLTRVMTYSHFLSDIVAGAFTGMAGSLLALYLMNKYSRFQVFKK